VLQLRALNSPALLRGSIYPHALRIVLGSIYDQSGTASFDEDRVEEWKTFVTVLMGEAWVRDMEEADNTDERVEEVVNEFTNRGGYANKRLFQEQHDA
jgi:hypothetical protein